MRRSEYRIVEVVENERTWFEVERRRWWWPFWTVGAFGMYFMWKSFDAYRFNSLEDARDFVRCRGFIGIPRLNRRKVIEAYGS